jgi:hypothetical protein
MSRHVGLPIRAGSREASPVRIMMDWEFKALKQLKGHYQPTATMIRIILARRSVSGSQAD